MGWLEDAVAEEKARSLSQAEELADTAARAPKSGWLADAVDEEDARRARLRNLAAEYAHGRLERSPDMYAGVDMRNVPNVPANERELFKQMQAEVMATEQPQRSFAKQIQEGLSMGVQRMGKSVTGAAAEAGMPGLDPQYERFARDVEGAGYATASKDVSGLPWLSAEGFTKKMAAGAAEMLPAMVAGGLMMKGVGGLVGKQLAPAIGAASAASAGAGAGTAAGVAFWGAQEGLDVSDGLRAAGASDAVANGVGMAVGPLIGYIEFLQVKKLVPKNFAKQLREATVKDVRGWAVEGLKTYGKEWGEEWAQGATSLAAKRIGQALDENVKFDWQREWANYFDEMKQAGASMLPITAGGAALGGVAARREWAARRMELESARAEHKRRMDERSGRVRVPAAAVDANAPILPPEVPQTSADLEKWVAEQAVRKAEIEAKKRAEAEEEAMQATHAFDELLEDKGDETPTTEDRGERLADSGMGTGSPRVELREPVADAERHGAAEGGGGVQEPVAGVAVGGVYDADKYLRELGEAFPGLRDNVLARMRKRGYSEDDAEDVASRIATKATAAIRAQKYDLSKATSGVAGWMAGMIDHEIAGFERERARQPGQLDVDVAAGTQPDVQAERNEALNPETYESMTDEGVRDAAAGMGVDINRAKTRAARLKEIQKRIERLGVQGDRGADSGTGDAGVGVDRETGAVGVGAGSPTQATEGPVAVPAAVPNAAVPGPVPAAEPETRPAEPVAPPAQAVEAEVAAQRRVLPQEGEYWRDGDSVLRVAKKEGKKVTLERLRGFDPSGNEDWGRVYAEPLNTDLWEATHGGAVKMSKDDVSAATAPKGFTIPGASTEHGKDETFETLQELRDAATTLYSNEDLSLLSKNRMLSNRVREVLEQASSDIEEANKTAAKQESQQPKASDTVSETAPPTTPVGENTKDVGVSATAGQDYSSMSDKELSDFIRGMYQQNRERRDAAGKVFDDQIADVNKQLRTHYVRGGMMRKGEKHRKEIDRLRAVLADIERQKSAAVPVSDPAFDAIRKHPASQEQDRRLLARRAAENAEIAAKRAELAAKTQEEAVEKSKQLGVGDVGRAAKSIVDYFDREAPKEKQWKDASEKEREEWRNGHVLAAFQSSEKLKAALDAGDIGAVEGMFGLHNPMWVEAFKSLTGKKIPRHNRGEFFREFFGPEKYDAYHSERNAKAEEKRAKEAAEREQKAIDSAVSQQVEWRSEDGTKETLTAKALIDRLLSQGWKPVAGKKGVVPVTRLTDGKSLVEFKDKLQRKYIEQASSGTPGQRSADAGEQPAAAGIAPPASGETGSMPGGQVAQPETQPAGEAVLPPAAPPAAPAPKRLGKKPTIVSQRGQTALPGLEEEAAMKEAEENTDKELAPFREDIRYAANELEGDVQDEFVEAHRKPLRKLYSTAQKLLESDGDLDFDELEESAGFPSVSAYTRDRDAASSMEDRRREVVMARVAGVLGDIVGKMREFKGIKAGEVVWDTAQGRSMKVEKFVFGDDGTLRLFGTAHDRRGRPDIEVEDAEYKDVRKLEPEQVKDVRLQSILDGKPAVVSEETLDDWESTYPESAARLRTAFNRDDPSEESYVVWSIEHDPPAGLEKMTRKLGRSEFQRLEASLPNTDVKEGTANAEQVSSTEPVHADVEARIGEGVAAPAREEAGAAEGGRGVPERGRAEGEVPVAAEQEAEEVAPAAKQLPAGWKEEDVREILAEVEKGNKVLLGGNELGMPDMRDIPHPQHVGFGMFKASTPDYDINWDAGGSMIRTQNGRGYTIVRTTRGVFPYDFEKMKATLKSFLPGEAATAQAVATEHPAAETNPAAASSDMVSGDSEAAMADLFAQTMMEAETPPAAETPKRPKKGSKPAKTSKRPESAAAREQRRKREDESLAAGKAAAEAEVKAGIDQFLKGIKGLKTTAPMNAPLNADIVQGLARAAKGLVKLGIYDFAVLVKRIAEAAGVDVVRQYGRVMELGWNKVRESNPNMQPSVHVADILKEIEDGRRGRPERDGHDAAGGHGDRHVEDDQAQGGAATDRGGEAGGGRGDAGVPDRDAIGNAVEAGDERDGGGIGSGEAAAAHTGHQLDRPPGDREASQAHDFRITEDFAEQIEQGGNVAKFERNLAAMRLLRTLEEEKRKPTPEEKMVLAKQTGWGQFKPYFRNDTQLRRLGVYDPKKTEWNAEAISAAESATEPIKFGDEPIIDMADINHRRALELIKAMTPDEYRAARASVRFSHYTAPEVARSMWKWIERVIPRGAKKVRVSDPGQGNGIMWGTIPASIATRAEKWGADPDERSLRVSELLYETVRHDSRKFEEIEYPDGFFDIYIANPPFAKTPVFSEFDADISELKPSLHNFFALKMAKKTRDGGLIAFIVTHHFMDQGDVAIREAMQDKFGARFLGAVRLPNTAFEDIAGTSVTADIVFFQKGGKGADVPWMTSELQSMDGRDKDKHPTIVQVGVNEYFVNNPHMVIGEMDGLGTMHPLTEDRGELRVTGQFDDLAGEIAQRLAGIDIDQQAFDEGKTTTEETYKASASAMPLEDLPAFVNDVSVGNLFIHDGGLWLREKKYATRMQGRAGKLGEKNPLARAKDWLALRDATVMLSVLQVSEAASDREVDAARAELNRQYDAFAKQWGPLNNRTNISYFRGDWLNFPDVLALENFDRDTQIATKADVFTTRTQHPPTQRPTSADTPEAALAFSLQARGVVDQEYIAQLMGKSTDEALEALGDLVYENPDGGLELKETYLSGNVRSKLAVAKEKASTEPRFTRNVDALEKVVPKDAQPGEIKAPPGGIWIPPEVYQQFVADTFGVSDVTFTRLGNQAGGWKMDAPTWAADYGNIKNTETFRAGTWNGVDLFERLVNPGRDLVVRVYDERGRIVRDDDGRAVINEEATADAKVKSTDIRRLWDEWLWQDPVRAETLKRGYNDWGRNYVRPELPEWMISLEGMSESWKKMVRDFQKGGAARMLQGNTMLAYVVGLGKTLTAAIGVTEGKRLGMWRKPAVVAPKHLVAQWGAEFKSYYPGAKILIATEDDFTPVSRRAFFNRIKNGDWDLVVIPEPSFKKIPMSPGRVSEFFRIQTAELDEAIATAAAEASGDENRRRPAALAALEEAKARLEDRMHKMLDAANKDPGPFFDDLGIDYLVVDEAQGFKNLYYTTRNSRIPGINNQGNEKTFDMLMKTDFLNEMTGGKGLTFSTGTPISNSIAELWVMQRYLQPGTLRELGIFNFDDWKQVFGEVQTLTRIDPIGNKFRTEQRFQSFVNVPELFRIWSQVADTKTRKDVKDLKVPPIKTGAPQAIQLKPHPLVSEYMVGLANRAETLDPRDNRTDNILKVMGDGIKAAIDMRLINPDAPELPGSKLSEAADRVFDIYKRFDAIKGTQIIWLDHGVPKKPKKLTDNMIAVGEWLLSEGGKATVAEMFQKWERVHGYRKNGRAGFRTWLREISDDVEFEDGDEGDTTSSINIGTKEEPKWVSGILSAEDDINVPTTPPWNAYEDIKAKLLAKGVKESEVAFIHDYKTDIQKQNLFAKLNNGTVRIVLASTPKMGTGANVQKRMVGAHELDSPWRPSDIEQRMGRAVRQGNDVEELCKKAGIPFEGLELLRYVTEGSIDARYWQQNEDKQHGLDSFASGDENLRTISEDDGNAALFAALKAHAANNPKFMEQVQLTEQVRELSAAQTRHQSNMGRLRDEVVETRTRSIPRMKETIARGEKIDAQVKKVTETLPAGSEFDFEIDGKNYRTVAEAEEVLRAQFTEMTKWLGVKELPEKTEKADTIRAEWEKVHDAHTSAEKKMWLFGFPVKVTAVVGWVNEKTGKTRRGNSFQRKQIGRESKKDQEAWKWGWVSAYITLDALSPSGHYRLDIDNNALKSSLRDLRNYIAKGHAAENAQLRSMIENQDRKADVLDQESNTPFKRADELRDLSGRLTQLQHELGHNAGDALVKAWTASRELIEHLGGEDSRVVQFMLMRTNGDIGDRIGSVSKGTKEYDVFTYNPAEEEGNRFPPKSGQVWVAPVGDEAAGTWESITRDGRVWGQSVSAEPPPDIEGGVRGFSEDVDAPVGVRSRSAQAFDEAMAATRKFNGELGFGMNPFLNAKAYPAAVAAARAWIKFGVRTLEEFLEKMAKAMRPERFAAGKEMLTKAWNEVMAEKPAVSDTVSETEPEATSAPAAPPDTVSETQRTPPAAQEQPPAAKAMPEARQPQNVASEPPEARSGAQAAAPIGAPGDITSIKHAVMDELRAAHGLAPRTVASPESFKLWLDTAAAKIAADVTWPDRLVQEFAADPTRTHTKVEAAAFSIYLRQLENGIEQGRADQAAATKAGDANAIQAAQTVVADKLQRLDALADVLTQSGSETGRALVARKIALARDFSEAGIRMRVLKNQAGQPLSKEQESQIAADAAKMKELEAANAKANALAEEVAAERALNKVLNERIDKLVKETDAKKEAPKPAKPEEKTKKTGPTWVERAEKHVAEAWDDVLVAFRRSKSRPLAGGLDPELLSAAGKLVAAYVELGVASLSEFMAHVAAKMGALSPQEDAAFRQAWTDMETAGKIDPIELDDPDDLAEQSRTARELLKALIEAGARGRENLVDLVHAEMEKIIPGFTRRQTQGALAGEGLYRPPTEDELKLLLRDTIGQLQQQVNIDRLENKLPAVRYGEGRPEMSDEQRRLLQQKNDLLRENRLLGANSERYAKSALQAAKTAIRHWIADRRHEMAQNPPTKIVRQRHETQTDAELEALQEERDEVKYAWDAVFPKEPMSDEKRAELVEKALDRAIASLEADLDAGNLEPRKMGRPAVTSASIEEKRARLKALQAHRKELRDNSPAYQATLAEKQSAAYDRILADRLAALQKRIAEKDWAPREPDAKRERTKEQLDTLFLIDQHKKHIIEQEAKWKRAHRTTQEKVLQSPLAIQQNIRALWTTGELSSFLRQGLFGAMMRPGTSVKSWRPAIEAWNEKKAFEQSEAMRNDPMYQFALKAKLPITESLDGAYFSQEEAFQGGEFASRWFPGIKRFSRVYVAQLNKQRFDLFKLYWSMRMAAGGLDESTQEGRAATMEQAKALAKWVSVVTGRGVVKEQWANAVSGLSLFLFAPRFVLSRFEFLTGMPLWGMGADAKTRKLVAVEYGRFAVSTATIYALAHLAAAAFWDDDDDDKPTVSYDPRSSDFMKIKVGDMRIDPLGGLLQTTVALGRLGAGEVKRGSGEVVPIRDAYTWSSSGKEVPYGGDRAGDVAFRFLRSKLAPAWGIGLDLLSGENMVGKPITAATPLEWVFPITWRQVYDAITEDGWKPSNPAERAGMVRYLACLSSVLGVNMDVYATFGANPTVRRQTERLWELQGQTEQTGKDIVELATLNHWYRKAFVPLSRQAKSAPESERRRLEDELKESVGKMADYRKESIAEMRKVAARAIPKFSGDQEKWQQKREEWRAARAKAQKALSSVGW